MNLAPRVRGRLEEQDPEAKDLFQHFDKRLADAAAAAQVGPALLAPLGLGRHLNAASLRPRRAWAVQHALNLARVASSDAVPGKERSPGLADSPANESLWAAGKHVSLVRRSLLLWRRGATSGRSLNCRATPPRRGSCALILGCAL